MPALRTRDTQARSLEVTTTDDAPQPPVLNILSPTPRALIFPITHNLSDSPYPSPSNSPFQPLEPDLYPLTLQCTLSSTSTSTPPPPSASTLSPESPLRSPSSPFVPEHKPRRPSCSNSSDLVERRPRKGDEDYVKRPENAFILFRRKCCEDRQHAGDVAAADGATKKQRQADLSKTISQQWKSLSAEERHFWEQMAKDKKKEHEQLYPNYVYRPQRAKDKDGKTKNKKTKKVDEDTGSSLSFVVPVHRHYCRSTSAPTPPPYQSIQIPNVYRSTPSCPTSPSLLSLISRRSAHPGHLEEVMSSFDYLPNNAYVPPSFPAPGQFEMNLQSSEFLRNMLSTSGDSSPSSAGPYTPVSTLIPENYLPSDPCNNNTNNVDAQARAEIDLQIEMQRQDQSLWGSESVLLRDDFDLNSIEMEMQQGFAACSWGNSGEHQSWGSEPVLLRDDFVPPTELGMPKYTENLTLAGPNTSGLEFGHEFSQHVVEGQPYLDDSQSLNDFLVFEEMMTGHGF